MKIVFMGTPDFAVGSLEALYKENEIVAVFTQPDKPQGRKMILTPPPVKVTAERLGIPVFQPRTLRDGEAMGILKSFEFDIIVVVAYGKMLPNEILNMPKYGCVNIHGSVLPKYRGASPIQWAIVSGETKTGVTAQFMGEEMDTGDIIAISETDIIPEDNSETMFKKLAEIGATLAAKTVSSIENGTATRTKQNESDASYAPIIKKEMAALDFSKTADENVNLIRGLISWPTAYFYHNGQRIKVFKAATEKGEGKHFGTVLCSSGRLIIECGDNTAIEILEVAPEGKGKMTARDMLNGRKIEEGSNLCG